MLDLAQQLRLRFEDSSWEGQVLIVQPCEEHFCAKWPEVDDIEVTEFANQFEAYLEINKEILFT